VANRQTTKQAKSSIKTGTGPVNKPARKGEREARRRNPRGRLGSGSTAAQTDAAAGLREASSKRSAVLQNGTEAVDQATVRAELELEAGNLGSARGPGADRPPASTKRAMLIGMLERPEGASVAEIGQRLGWLPHTVRAAITGLRQAGREVTRSKNGKGQSVYRLAPVKPAKP